MTVGAELGFPGLGFLLTFYGLTLWHLGKLARNRQYLDPRIVSSAYMALTGLSGFIVSASFISATGLQCPYFVALLGLEP